MFRKLEEIYHPQMFDDNETLFKILMQCTDWEIVRCMQ